jgi:hypothetical protein
MRDWGFEQTHSSLQLLEALSECVNAIHRFPYEG